MKRFKFLYYWLITTSWLIFGFGLCIVIINQTALSDSFNKPIMAAFNLSPGTVIPGKAFIWLYSVLGATMAGWGIFILFVLKNAFVKKEKWSWVALTISMIVWFIPDTLISALYGAYFNVIVNTLLLIIIVLPLSFTYQDFFPGKYQKHL
jgi:hypothetical protein